MNTKLIISLIIVIALIVSIAVAINNFNNELQEIETRKQINKDLDSAQQDIIEADRILRESGN